MYGSTGGKMKAKHESGSTNKFEMITFDPFKCMVHLASLYANGIVLIFSGYLIVL